MTDPYNPILEDFQYEEDEIEAIKAAMQNAKPWDWKPGGEQEEALNRAKIKIRDYHLRRHRFACCYCRVNLYGAGPFMTDREHVLPKGKVSYKPYTYEIWNLAVACKRCNMQFKGDCDAFVIDRADPMAYLKSENYSFIHPNFDRWEDHLNRITFQSNTSYIVKFTRVPGSHKADYSYKYFNLRGLEVDSFDEAQGRVVRDEISNLVTQVRKLAEEFDQ